MRRSAVVAVWAAALVITGTGVAMAWPHLSAWAMGSVDDPAEGRHGGRGHQHRPADLRRIRRRAGRRRRQPHRPGRRDLGAVVVRAVRRLGHIQCRSVHQNQTSGDHNTGSSRRRIAADEAAA